MQTEPRGSWKGAESAARETPSFLCPVCGSISFNPNDVAEGYCGNCHAFTRNCMYCKAELRHAELQPVRRFDKDEQDFAVVGVLCGPQTSRQCYMAFPNESGITPESLIAHCKWTAQTVHQAYHVAQGGEWQVCPSDICLSTRHALGMD